MTLKTDRLTILPLRASHAEQLSDLLDPKVNVHFQPEDVPTTVAALRDQFARMEAASRGTRISGAYLPCTVTLSRSGQAIGRVEALVHGQDAEVSFVFVADAWGHGYASEAVGALASKLKRDGVERLWACVTPGNTASLALCRRLSFEPSSLPDTFEAATFDKGDLVLSLKL
jgi:RimJ/RimL family protein N-acetyltransferase